MRLPKIRPISVAAGQYLAIARKFGNRHAGLKKGVKYASYDGALFRTTATPKRLTTDIVVLPVAALGVELTSRDTLDFINGRAAHIRRTDLVSFSRDVFYKNDETDSLGSTRPATVPDAFAFGEAMPGSIESLVYTGFTGRLVEGYTALRSSRSFDQLYVGTFDDESGPFVSNADSFWVELMLARAGGDRFTRLTFSEAWLQLYAPGHVLVSRSQRYRATPGHTAACSNGHRVALSFQMLDTGPFNYEANNYDTGVCNVLTLCLSLDTEEPEVLWYHLWDRVAQGDPRIAPYKFWPEPGYDPNDYPYAPRAGTLSNTAVSTLEMADTGEVFGVRSATTMVKLPEYVTAPLGYENGSLNTLPVSGHVVNYVEWSPTGAYSETAIAQACEAGLAYYRAVQNEGSIPALAKAEMLGFLEAYGVGNITLVDGGSGYARYNARFFAAGYENGEKFIFVAAQVFIADLTIDGVLTDVSAQRYINAANSSSFTVLRKGAAGAFVFTTYKTADITFELAGTREAVGRGDIGFDRDALTFYLNVQNLYAPATAYAGRGVFATTVVDALNDAVINVSLGVFSLSEFYARGIPGTSDTDGTVADQTVRVIQSQRAPLSGVETDPDLPFVLILRGDTGVYITNDGGLQWTKVFADNIYRDAAYLSNSLVVRPFDKQERAK